MRPNKPKRKPRSLAEEVRDVLWSACRSLSWEEYSRMERRVVGLINRRTRTAKERT